jgi:hypothetical protein
MSQFHAKYVVVPVDKAPTNIVVVCKSHYKDCLYGIRYWQFISQPCIYPDDTSQKCIKLKDRASFFRFLKKPLNEICLVRIKEQISEKRSTVYTSSRYSVCLLKNISTKCNKPFCSITSKLTVRAETLRQKKLPLLICKLLLLIYKSSILMFNITLLIWKLPTQIFNKR